MTINKTRPTNPAVNGDSISLRDDIEAEFGATPGHKFGSYRNISSDFKNKKCGQLQDLPLDTGIPKSGEIKFSDFYGKRLNIVVDYYTGGREIRQTSTPTLAATHRFKNSPTGNTTKIVGGFQTLSKLAATVSNAQNHFTLTSGKWGGGKKVFVHVNKEIGGKNSNANNNRHQVSLRTGKWPAGTILQVDVGTSGRIQGSGGRGGNGSGTSNDAQGGFTGRSGLGVEYSATINNNGIIRCGYGGGGGGSGAANDPSDKSTTDFGRGGSGGGGGAGIPAGGGGAAGGGGFNGTRPYSSPGSGGNKNGGGNGGPSRSEGGATGGKGGNGADQVDFAAGNGAKGTQGRPGVGYGPPGDPGLGGSNGRAICYRTNGIKNSTTINGNGVGGNNGGTVVTAFT